MSGRKRSTLDDEQLHEQFKWFEQAIDNIDDTYLLVGSSTLNALFNYVPRVPSKDEEQYVFDQMKQVYKSLSAVGDYCAKKNPFQAILLYENKVLSRLDALQEKKIVSPSLLEDVLESTGIVTKKNKMTVLRDSGSRLFHNVMDRGPYQGNRNIMLQDYSDIEAAFK